MRKFIYLLAFFFSVSLLCPEAHAAVEVKVYITEGTLNHAINRTMSVGETRTGWGIELNEGRKVKSAVWQSTDTGVATVVGGAAGATVTAHKEGTARLRLTVVTDKNETVSTDCLISSVTVLKEQPVGYVQESADFYRGASTDSKVRNTGQAGQKLTVIAQCSDFYRVRLPEDYDFKDELDQATTYVQKSDITIPVTEIKMERPEAGTILNAGETLALHVSIKPALATRKEILWSSDNPDIASVTDKGVVTPHKSGLAEITAREKYSGVSASHKVLVNWRVLAPARIYKHNLVLEKDNDFRGNYVGWQKMTGASYYRLYKGTWKPKKKRIVYKSKKLTKAGYYDTKVKKGIVYHYYLRAYNRAGKCLDKSRKIKIRATAPELTAEPNSLDSIRLNWKPKKSRYLHGIKGYRIYRSKKENGRYKCIKQIKKKKKFQWDDKKLKTSTTYYYKVCAYQKRKKKLKNGAMSAIATAKTYATVSEETNWNYFYSMKNKWNGVCMEQKEVTEAQSIQKMNNYGITRKGKTAYPYIKYHLTTNKLYIHMYVDFLSYKKVGNKTVRVAPPSGRIKYEGKEQGKTYREEFIDGVRYAYEIGVQGDRGDFAPGVNFQTRFILHEKGKEALPSKQHYLEIRIGGECPDCPEQDWFHGDILGTDVADPGDSHLYMAVNEELGRQETPLNFRCLSAHELGHTLGLWDGYLVETREGNIIDRMRENGETCIYTNDDKWKNIMKCDREEEKITANDVEMMLLAYGRSADDKDDVSQAYQDYVYQGRYETSEVIRDRKDEQKDGKTVYEKLW